MRTIECRVRLPCSAELKETANPSGYAVSLIFGFYNCRYFTTIRSRIYAVCQTRKKICNMKFFMILYNLIAFHSTVNQEIFS